ncbi:TetR/AcrR family transcriptional regulator [Candidatus Blastococcus massiliensis]|uniref:TetR/AcrR family transcriptional regulator n=1 Tax=Candidatus Blastococcus massiliensis TaxID=1470358 RepID=UPI0004B67858|nr:TetR/AcrR family transcriptional regulator [Candidatus Blastococcus massiliensis]
MGDLGDRRARKKAATRELIRTTAHRLFAQHGFDTITIADVAREADVVVQTVFNHFATKEELFFDGRAFWVDGPATAVRDRPAGVDVLSALRSHLLRFIATDLGSLCTAEQRGYRATVSASETLRMYERGLVFEAEYRLADALRESWADDAEFGHVVPSDPATSAPLTAALWLAAARVLVVENRLRVADGHPAAEVAANAEELADRLLGRMQAGSAAVTDLRTPLSTPARTRDRRVS